MTRYPIGKGTPEESLMSAIFGGKPWDPRFPRFYPYTVTIKEDEEKSVLGIGEAIQEVLNTLPLYRRRGDPREWDAYRRVLELRFGLRDGTPRTLKEVGREVGGIRAELVRQLEKKALMMMRHPVRSRRLSEFFVLSPEEMARKNRDLQKSREALRGAEERIARLMAILATNGLHEQDFERVEREASEDQEALQALRKKFPCNLFWNAVVRAGVRRLSELKKLVKNGEIQQVKQIGPKGEEFFKQILRAAELEAPS